MELTLTKTFSVVIDTETEIDRINNAFEGDQLLKSLLLDITQSVFDGDFDGLPQIYTDSDYAWTEHVKALHEDDDLYGSKLFSFLNESVQDIVSSVVQWHGLKSRYEDNPSALSHFSTLIPQYKIDHNLVNSNKLSHP